jgi:hypothetical protein
MSGTTYKLSGSASNFSTLVGKKVEVKGTLQKGDSSSSSSAAGATPSAEPGAASSSRSSSSDKSMQQIRVTSVREVGGSCS